jgi:hypothetical protein
MVCKLPLMGSVGQRVGRAEKAEDTWGVPSTWTIAIIMSHDELISRRRADGTLGNDRMSCSLGPSAAESAAEEHSKRAYPGTHPPAQ